MANTKNNKDQTITLNDKKYNISDMNSDQKNYLAHVSDLIWGVLKVLLN